MSTVVNLDRISKAYEKKIAVKDLSLQIDSGVMFGLLGPNGAGKTSSIRMMIGKIGRASCRERVCYAV